MKTRKILGAIFSVLIILSLALSTVPFVAEEGYEVVCGHPRSCPWALDNPDYAKIISGADPDCCCKLTSTPYQVVC